MKNNVKFCFRVASIRSRKTHGIIFSGYPITKKGHQDNRRVYVVKAVGKEYKDIQIGELWEVQGILTKQIIKINGYAKTEPLINAKTLSLLKPSGNQVIRWIVENNSIRGIGNVKAQKLYSILGEDLYRALDDGDLGTIMKIINNQEIAQNLIDIWAVDGDTKTLKWMQEKKIPLSLSRKVLRYHGRKTLSALNEDPYRLLSFCASWKFVDNIAMRIMEIREDDPRRLQAAIEQVLYEQMANGHSCLAKENIKQHVRKLLNSNDLAETSLNLAEFNKSIKVVGNTLHSAGAWIMERSVAEFIKRSVNQTHQLPLMSKTVDKLIDEFEKKEARFLNDPDFALNQAQRDAVKCSFENSFSVITGGAGVGKTTVLKALYHLFDHVGRPRYQMALSGRAAKRMYEATGERSSTIAGFLQNLSSSALGSNPVIVIDEASMVDLSSMYRLIRRLPENCHIVLVGDPHQLPPISAGLILHCMMDVKNLPISKLTEVKRQANDSHIPHFARAVRDGIWPEGMFTKSIENQILIVPCPNSQVVERVVELYEKDRDNTKILSATNANPFSGCKPINNACRYRFTASKGAKHLKIYDEPTGLYEGDLLLYTKNDWERDLQNGSLGVLIEAFDEPQKLLIGDGDDQNEVTAFGRAEWDGRLIPIIESDIEALMLGYAVTIHKAQGSQFNRVIIPLTKGRIDRTLIYTAITRAVKQIILVGDIRVAEKAVTLPPSATLRSVGLPEMLN